MGRNLSPPHVNCELREHFRHAFCTSIYQDVNRNGVNCEAISGNAMSYPGGKDVQTKYVSTDFYGRVRLGRRRVDRYRRRPERLATAVCELLLRSTTRIVLPLRSAVSDVLPRLLRPTVLPTVLRSVLRTA